MHNCHNCQKKWKNLSFLSKNWGNCLKLRKASRGFLSIISFLKVNIAGTTFLKGAKVETQTNSLCYMSIEKYSIRNDISKRTECRDREITPTEEGVRHRSVVLRED